MRESQSPQDPNNPDWIISAQMANWPDVWPSLFLWLSVLCCPFEKKCTKCFILTGHDEKTFVTSLRRNSAEQSTLNHGICVKINSF